MIYSLHVLSQSSVCLEKVYLLHLNSVLPLKLRQILIYLHFPGAQNRARYTVGGSVALSPSPLSTNA